MDRITSETMTQPLFLRNRGINSENNTKEDYFNIKCLYAVADTRRQKFYKKKFLLHVIHQKKKDLSLHVNNISVEILEFKGLWLYT